MGQLTDPQSFTFPRHDSLTQLLPSLTAQPPLHHRCDGSGRVRAVCPECAPSSLEWRTLCPNSPPKLSALPALTLLVPAGNTARNKNEQFPGPASSRLGPGYARPLLENCLPAFTLFARAFFCPPQKAILLISPVWYNMPCSTWHFFCRYHHYLWQSTNRPLSL